MSAAIRWASLVVCLPILLTACRSDLDKVREEFIDNCKGAGTSTALCTCAIDKLQARYGKNGLVSIQKQGEVPQDFFDQVIQAGAQCRNGGGEPTIFSLAEGRGETPAKQEEKPGILGEPVEWRDGRVYSRSTADELSRGTPANLAELEGAVELVIKDVKVRDSGTEFREARHSVTGDLNADKQTDIAAIFTIEGAEDNRYFQYLVVAAGNPDGTVQWADTIVVGGRGNEVTGLKIEAGAIRLATLTQGPDDPDCCPTLAGSTEYILRNGKLRKLM